MLSVAVRARLTADRRAQIFALEAVQAARTLTRIEAATLAALHRWQRINRNSRAYRLPSLIEAAEARVAAGKRRVADGGDRYAVGALAKANARLDRYRREAEEIGLG